MGAIRPSTPSTAAPVPSTKAARVEQPIGNAGGAADAPAVPGGSSTDTSSQAADGAKALKDGARSGPGTAAPAPTPAATDTTKPSVPGQEVPKQDTPAAKPTVTEQLEAARNNKPSAAELRNLPPEDQQSIRDTYQAEQSKLYDTVATQLEQQGRPTRGEFTVNGKFLSWEYQDALSYYDGQLEEAQQGAKPERVRAMRAELAETPAGREMLEFEKRAGVPIKVLTTAEWRRAGHADNVAAFAAGEEGITFKADSLNAHVYVHEMTHEVDHYTKVLAPPEDTRTREQVIQEATANYEKYGLDPGEVPALVDATYHQGPDHTTLTHAHTRLAEARLHRQQHGGTPLDDGEIRQVLSLSLPREQDNRAIDLYNEAVEHDPASAPDALVKLREYALTRGIEAAGMSADDLIALLNGRKAGFEAKIVDLEQAGTRSSSGGGQKGGVGGVASGLGGLAGIGGAVGSIMRGASGLAGAAHGAGT
ncbi:MAG: hypothetical protein JWL76_997 [Thermoleophilia bacterium]|nr:hypothetical protein [Thermoleophilia bacterium]